MAASSIVALITLTLFEDAILRDSPTNFDHLDYCWRILIGAGCVPGVIAMYFRLTIPETPRFTMDIERNVKQACRNIAIVLSANGVAPGVWHVDPEASTERTDAPRASIRDFKRYFGRWKNLRVLLGTAYSWFALDVRKRLTVDEEELSNHEPLAQIAFYGLGLNSSKIFDAKIFLALGLGANTSSGTPRDVYNNLHDTTVCTLIVIASGLLPGYLASFLSIDSWGRKPIQLMGFTVLSALFLIMGTAHR